MLERRQRLKEIERVGGVVVSEKNEGEKKCDERGKEPMKETDGRRGTHGGGGWKRNKVCC